MMHGEIVIAIWAKSNVRGHLCTLDKSLVSDRSEAFPGILRNKGTCSFIFREQGNIGKYFKGTRERN